MENSLKYKIVEIVAESMGVSINDIMSKKRNREYCYPRQISICLIAEFCREKTTAIGRFFDRDHSTVVHTRRYIYGLCDTYPEELDMLNLLREKVRTTLFPEEALRKEDQYTELFRCYTAVKIELRKEQRERQRLEEENNLLKSITRMA